MPSEQDALHDEIEALLTPQGFRKGSPVHYEAVAWSTRHTDDRFFLVVVARLHRRSPCLEVMAYYPGTREPNNIGTVAVAPQQIAMPHDDWQARLANRLERVRGLISDKAKIRCPHCQSLMIARVAKSGPHEGETFHGCRRYPDCRGLRASWKVSMAGDDGKVLGLRCPDCGQSMATRYARKGPNKGNSFIGCTGYPNCKRILSDEEAVAIQLMGDQPDPPNTEIPDFRT